MAAAALRRRLLSWYRLNRRDLPWRRNVSAYRTWVSEIMLQQTTVRTVLPYYARFLSLFPDVRALARAPLPRVLKAWAGLGYYSRARNLHEAARRIVSERGGRLPGDYEGWRGLPGVGRYTAGAILSIAFGEPLPVLDGNVARVFSRLFAIRDDVKSPRGQKRLWALAGRLVPRQAPGDWNQALMELGATVCLPEAPDCGACPMAGSCAARRQGLQERLPVSGPRRAPVDLRWVCLWTVDDGKVLLHKRPESERFLKGHWGLPEARHLGAKPGRLLKTARHSITHHRILLEVRAAEPPARLSPACRWVPRARLRDYLVSSLWLKSLPSQTP